MEYYSKSEVIHAAVNFIRDDMIRGNTYNRPEEIGSYLICKLHDLEHEIFGVLHLDNRMGLIEDQELFRGTIDGAAVYPREVVKEGLARNTKHMIFYHNHPSGIAEPSRADRDLTRRLIDALSLVDISVRDHFVIGGAEYVSFATRGFL